MRGGVGAMRVRSKLWIEKGGEQVFGAGKARMLKAVAKTGSLNAAAHELGMSYRHVWSSIRAAEQRLGRALLVKTKGGKKGGGAAVTPYAKDLIGKFERLEKDIRTMTNKRFAEIFRD
ncbi:MAG: LysR family transcriptional regulator [Kiritimatiellae bacterium]|nr:LysR family transcriptional regulator [Kiritimatiellia bacterium]